ncbi:MAG: PaaI family thioesterase, partial [Euryarchaeota archaeon]|nr:PaaI family thioesterase [Euryarchaeota archaeon]
YSIKLRRPTPLGVLLIVRSQISKVDGSRVEVEMTLEADGKVCASGSGLFVAVEEGHPAYHRWS